MPDPDALRALLIAAADGDRSALEPLFGLLAPLVRAYCRRVLGAPSADDAAQDALLDIFRRTAEYDSSRPALGWVLGLATWQCRTHARRIHRRAEVGATAAATEASEDGLALVIDRDLIAAALDVLAALPPHDSTVLVADILETAATDAAPATLRKRLERARTPAHRLEDSPWHQLTTPSRSTDCAASTSATA